MSVPVNEVERLHAILNALGLDSIIDVHTHFMPQRVLDKVWDYFDQAETVLGRAWPITYRVDEPERLAALRGFGVSRFTSLTYPHKPEMAQWLNSWTADFAARTPDCLHSATFYPEPGVAQYVREAINSGARVFKAHIRVGDYDPNDPLLDGVWSRLSETGVPVVIHSGHGPTSGQFTGVAGMERLLERYPELVLIVAHLGMPEYERFLDLCERYPGVHLDTTMAFTRFVEAIDPFPPQALPRLAQVGDRIVFGSDFPNIPYPYVDAVEAVLGLGLGEAWARKVLHDNAARLFALSPAQ